MANIKSQKKRIITNEKAHIRNVAIKTQLKHATRKVKDAVEANDASNAYKYALDACKLLDRACSKGVLHKNQAANRKSGIMALANTIVTDKERKAYKPTKKVTPKKKGGTKKAKAKEERKANMKKASEAKAKRRQKTLKDEQAAAKKKAAAEKAEQEAAAKEEGSEEAK